MKKELFIRTSSSRVDIAFLEDGKLVEFHQEKVNDNLSLNDIYIGRVAKIAAGLNAAFIDLRQPKLGFLAYRDLGAEFPSYKNYLSQIANNGSPLNQSNLPKTNQTLSKHGDISQVVQPNDRLLVQVSKEPISSKGSRLTSEITIAGRYVVLIPMSNRISFSQKIKSSVEKKNIFRLIQKKIPKNFGVIIRTSALGKSEQSIADDLNVCLERWRLLVKRVHNHNGQPKKLLGEIDRSLAIIRDKLDRDFSSIWVDNITLYETISDYLKTISPEETSILKFHRKATPIFEHFKIERQINSVFRKTITIKHGAYLTIEATEALHIIDVNSGRQYNKSANEQETAYEVNMSASEEIARQIRLRDLGGIIVIDFIDLRKASERTQLIRKLKEEMANDMAKHRIYPPTKLGLVQISRQRVRTHRTPNQSKKVKISPEKVKAPFLVLEDINRSIEHVLNHKSNKNKSIYLHVDPFVAAYIKKGYPSLRLKWYLRYRKWIRVIAREQFHYLDFKLLDRSLNQLRQ